MAIITELGESNLNRGAFGKLLGALPEAPKPQQAPGRSRMLQDAPGCSRKPSGEVPGKIQEKSYC